MVTLLDFLGQLVTSTIRLIIVFFTDVAFRQPIDVLALVNWLAGTVLIAVSVGVLGYLALGALVDLLGGTMWSPGRGNERQV